MPDLAEPRPEMLRVFTLPMRPFTTPCWTSITPASRSMCSHRRARTSDTRKPVHIATIAIVLCGSLSTPSSSWNFSGARSCGRLWRLLVPLILTSSIGLSTSPPCPCAIAGLRRGSLASSGRRSSRYCRTILRKHCSRSLGSPARQRRN